MKIESSAFKHNEKIPAKYTCDGEDISPPLAISDVPESAKSLVLIVDDPDAPIGTWVHWTVWNIPPQTKEAREGEALQGIEGATSFNKPGYGGPCPPFNPDHSVGAGTHRYFFKLYALDAMLDLPSSAMKGEIEKSMKGHIIAYQELVGLYERIAR